MKRFSDKIIKWVLAITLLWITGLSCTKLDVKTYSVIPSSSFWSNATEIAAGKAPAYAQLTNVVGHGNTGNQIEITSDEMVYPTRGTDWYDGGQWARMYYHQGAQSDVDGNLNGTWSDLFNGAGTCNFVIYTLQNLPAGTDVTLQQDIAEMTALRSLYYFKAMDLWGSIPYVTNFKVDPTTVTNIPRTQVFDSLETNLKGALPYLASNVDATTYGKVTKYMAFSLLARLYLNAEVYSGTARWADCIAMCDSVLNGPFSLEPDYFDCFHGVNTVSPENIFVVPMSSNGLINGNGLIQASIEFNSALTFGIPCCGYGNNGASTTQDFYQFFDTTSTYSYNTTTVNGRTVTNRLRTFNDQRAGQYLIGQQFQGDGVSNYPPYKNWIVDNTDVCCTYNGDASTQTTTKIGDFYNNLYSPTSYYPKMDKFTADATDATFRHAGVRNIKYWPQPGPSNGNMGNAWVVFRLADIYLMKGEAEYNLGLTGPALTDFNTVRERAYSNVAGHDWTAADLTPDNILAERGRELAWEDVRRTDLVRFGKYTEARLYPPKPADPDNHTLVLPIPQNQLSTNKNLKQNPGY